MEFQAKPRLVFFQYKYERLAPFLFLHQREHVDCLSQFFDVTVIQDDCDYRQVCDTYEPDLVMFESGVPFDSCKRPCVQNLRACTQVPKVGFLNADGFGEGRTGFLSDMDHWGIETFFAISITAAEHTPAVAAKVFVWPNFANPELYRDYGETKKIEVLFTGNKNTLYPWRRKIVRIAPRHYPSVICAHPGYSPGKMSGKVVVGEPYARMLNSAWMVPACGTVAKEIVRKHFEVPACRSCLVSERSAPLEAAGFVDMKNCVFVDETDVLEKLGYLLAHRDELQAVIDAGYKLVHSRHTMRHRDQVLQWYRLNKNLAANQKIIQTNPFEPLLMVDSNSGRETAHIHSNGGLVSLLREADGLLWQGAYSRAEEKYTQCVSYYRYMPEPLLGLTLCKLFQGAPQEAIKLIVEPLRATLAEYKAIDPDPVEWAYFIVILLCLGKLREAAKRSREYRWLRHPELDRVRWIMKGLLSRTPMGFTSPIEPRQYRLTVHQLPYRDVEEWVDHLVTTLRICGQAELAQDVAMFTSPESRVANEGELPTAGNGSEPFVEEADLRRAWSRKSPFVFVRTDACGFFNRLMLYRNTSLGLRQAAKIILRGADRMLEWLIPKRKDDFAKTIHKLTREQDIRTALFVGMPPQDVSAQAFLCGTRRNGNSSGLFCINWCSGRYTARASSAHVTRRSDTWYELPRSGEEAAGFLDSAIENIKNAIQNEAFDMVVIDSNDCAFQPSMSAVLTHELHMARFALLVGTNGTYNHDSYGALLRDRGYAVVEHNPELREGYVIFKRVKSSITSEAGTNVLVKAHA